MDPRGPLGVCGGRPTFSIRSLPYAGISLSPSLALCPRLSKQPRLTSGCLRRKRLPPRLKLQPHPAPLEFRCESPRSKTTSSGRSQRSRTDQDGRQSSKPIQRYVLLINCWSMIAKTHARCVLALGWPWVDGQPTPLKDYETFAISLMLITVTGIR